MPPLCHFIITKGDYLQTYRGQLSSQKKREKVGPGGKPTKSYRSSVSKEPSWKDHPVTSGSISVVRSDVRTFNASSTTQLAKQEQEETQITQNWEQLDFESPFKVSVSPGCGYGWIIHSHVSDPAGYV